MKYKNIIIIISVLINIILLTYGGLKLNQLKNAFSNMSLQVDLVQLESAIDYQVKNNWKEENTVLEKIEDIREGINYLMTTGENTGIISKGQENDLWKLYRYFSKYPDYTGFPNTKLNNNQKNELKELGDDLRSSGWGMNLGYSGDWKSFSNSINQLIN